MLTLRDTIVATLRPGQTVYLPGATGESLTLAAALAEDPLVATGVHFIGCFVPGMNVTDYAGLNPDVRLTTFMLPSAMHGSFRAGRVRLIPATYSGAARMLAGIACDVAFAHVAPPDARGRCSLGIASDFAPLVWPRARRRVLLVNAHMPVLPGAPTLALRDAHVVADASGALIEAPVQRRDVVADRIAARVAEIVPDHATIQTGIGAVPTAIWNCLGSHRGLALRSGLVPDGFRALAQTGALDRGLRHIAGIAYGSPDLYRFLAETDLVDFRPADETHALAALASCRRFHAINSALEVDLCGRLNVAWQQGRLIGGVGGLPDFARAATVAPDGCSIIALPATARSGAVSRVVPVLAEGTVGIGAEAVDVVVTEHGIADLRGLDLDRRAHALIAIAEPAEQDRLEAAWNAVRDAF